MPGRVVLLDPQGSTTFTHVTRAAQELEPRQPPKGSIMNEAQETTETTATQQPLHRRSLEEAISEVDREIKVRVRCYDRWVSEGKLSRIDARDRVERLQAALAYLEDYGKHACGA